MRRNEMNWNELAGNWKQLKGKVRQQWGDLSNNDLDMIAGNRDKLVGMLQEKYGYDRAQAKREVAEFLSSLEGDRGGEQTP
jgi:uncharacterized protein YjbJ (UPF0337 family)